jgi:hypothetical protein
MRFIWSNRLTLDKLRSWSNGVSLVVAAFFFWNGGIPEQRSQIGLLRSLLHETLRNRQDLIPEVFKDEWERKSVLAAHDMEMTLETWTLPQLQKAFGNLIDLAGPQLHMCFFIDGLDEYGKPKNAAHLVHELISKAAGVFL